VQPDQPHPSSNGLRRGAMLTAQAAHPAAQREARSGADEAVFVNRYGHPLTASGFRFRLCQYVKAASPQVPTLARKRITHEYLSG
jgi:hypothetical protein